MRRALATSGLSVHAVDHVLRGRGSDDHLRRLRYITELFGLRLQDLDRMLASLSEDTDTYYLSAESHNRWRGSVPYDAFPMRVCVSVHLVSAAEELREDSSTTSERPPTGSAS